MKISFAFIGCLALALLVRGQYQSGFISIDCGIAEGSDYEDDTTSIQYTSDMKYIDTGVNNNISSHFMSNTLTRQLHSVKSFPQGNKNCYTLKPAQAKGNNYLIRATFMYGDYDSEKHPPEFGLHLEVNEWDSVRFDNASHVVMKEIIHAPLTDYIHVCLVNTGSGTPFISALELRQFNNSIYKTESAGSLALFTRLDIGSTTNQTVRYKDDVYDRIWEPYGSSHWKTISAVYSESLSDDYYRPPASVMMSAVTPSNGSESISFTMGFILEPTIITQELYWYMHFAEVEQLQPNQLRKFVITLNGEYYPDPVVPEYLRPNIVYGKATFSPGSNIYLSITMTTDSTQPPILNALEMYIVQDLLRSPTDQIDVDAIRSIKSVYGVKRNWQGDPCAPGNYSWDGVGCSNSDYNPPAIILLNLSASALTGNIDPSFSGLKSLQHLDLSNNSLSGPVPDFLGQLSLLKSLNLSGNNLTGSVPCALIERSNNGSLSLSVDGNPNLGQKALCKRKKKNISVPVVIAIAASCLVLLIVVLVIILCYFRVKKTRVMELALMPKGEDEALELKSRQFTYSEVVRITKNFEELLGEGAFGTVYAGKLDDGTQVAVKMLSQSIEGSKQFRVEVQLLTKVHHRNLVSLIGYCNEGEYRGLICEYMDKGNLQNHLSENGGDLRWKSRIQIAIDAAQGFEYLHKRCKPPIIHRDIKSSNILLNEKLQAKVADFGISKLMPLDSITHVLSNVVGTFGYLDPEYFESQQLNEKSDVYSFGIVLLELVTGKAALKEQVNIKIWVQSMLERGDMKGIIDPRLKGDFDINSLSKTVETAMACVAISSIQRPTMTEALEELKKCLDMEMARVEGSGIIREDQETTSNASIATDPQTSMAPSQNKRKEIQEVSISVHEI